MDRLRLLVAWLATAGAVSCTAPDPPAYELALVDMQGHRQVLGKVPTSTFAPRVSPDGTRVAFEQEDGGGKSGLTRIHVAPLGDLGQRKPIEDGTGTGRSMAPVWAPDGSRVAYVVNGDGPDTLFHQRADGAAEPQYLREGRAIEGWYGDDRLVFITLAEDRDYGISTLDLLTGETSVLVDLPGSEQHSSRISPDGRWIAYASTETGRQEVWVEPLPVTGKRHQLTQAGGRHPQWSPDGTRIYFDDEAGQLYVMQFSDSAAGPVAGGPVALPIMGFVQGEYRRQYDLMPDGRGFVMLFTAVEGS